MIKPKFHIGEQVILNQTHENYFGVFFSGDKYKVKKIEVTYVLENENGDLIGHIDEHELSKT